MKKIVIIGAGYCGTVIAALLMRDRAHVPLDIVLLNRSGVHGRGMAYGTRSDEHLLNIPIGRMDALPDEAGGFLRYAQLRDPAVTAASFVVRKWFGDYLESLLEDAQRNLHAGDRFRMQVGDAADIALHRDGSGATVMLAQGETLAADRVILALGNFAPADPAIPSAQGAFYDSEKYVRDPWRADALRLVKADERVLLIGSGLTMLDVLLDLRAHGLRAPITALSRRGLVPLAHRELEAAPVYDPAFPRQLLARPQLRHWLRSLREQTAIAAASGHDWRDVIGGLRAATPALWQALTPADRQRFLRHLRPYWDVHRHRCAPELSLRMQAELRAGTLRLLAGRVLGFAELGKKVRASYRPRGQRHTETLDIDTVINCTGPESNTRATREPLIAALRDRGLIQPDVFGLGLEVAENYALLDRDHQTSGTLFYAGPFLRAGFWEATAVPELKIHASRLVAGVLQSL